MTLYVCILGKRYTYAIAQLAFALQIILQQTDLILELVQTQRTGVITTIHGMWCNAGTHTHHDTVFIYMRIITVYHLY